MLERIKHPRVLHEGSRFVLPKNMSADEAIEILESVHPMRGWRRLRGIIHNWFYGLLVRFQAYLMAREIRQIKKRYDLK